MSHLPVHRRDQHVAQPGRIHLQHHLGVVGQPAEAVDARLRLVLETVPQQVGRAVAGLMQRPHRERRGENVGLRRRQTVVVAQSVLLQPLPHLRRRLFEFAEQLLLQSCFQLRHGQAAGHGRGGENPGEGVRLGESCLPGEPAQPRQLALHQRLHHFAAGEAHQFVLRMQGAVHGRRHQKQGVIVESGLTLEPGVERFHGNRRRSGTVPFGGFLQCGREHAVGGAAAEGQ